MLSWSLFFPARKRLARGHMYCSNKVPKALLVLAVRSWTWIGVLCFGDLVLPMTFRIRICVLHHQLPIGYKNYLIWVSYGCAWKIFVCERSDSSNVRHQKIHRRRSEFPTKTRSKVRILGAGAFVYSYWHFSYYIVEVQLVSNGSTTLRDSDNCRKLGVRLLSSVGRWCLELTSGCWPGVLVNEASPDIELSDRLGGLASGATTASFTAIAVVFGPNAHGESRVVWTPDDDP